jgi:outer membrane protein TolC
VPITDWFKSKKNRKEYEFKDQQFELDLKQKNNDINYEIIKTKTEYENAQETMISSKNTYDFSQEVYKKSQKEYQIGTFLYSSVLDKEKSVSTAEQNYISAVYHFLTARLNYEIAVGKFR